MKTSICIVGVGLSSRNARSTSIRRRLDVDLARSRRGPAARAGRRRPPLDLEHLAGRQRQQLDARCRPSRSPSDHRQPSSSSAHHSSSPSAGASARATSRRSPAQRLGGVAVARTRRAARSGSRSVPARRSIAARPAVQRHPGPLGPSSAARGRVTWKEPSSPCGRPTRPATSQSASVGATSR